MSTGPVPIYEPIELGGTVKVTSPIWVLFFQNLLAAVTAAQSGVNTVAAVNAGVFIAITNMTLNNSHYFVEAVGTITLTLPDVTQLPGKQYYIKKIGAGVLTINTTTSQTIDGSASLTIDYPNVCLAVESDGVEWKII